MAEINISSTISNLESGCSCTFSISKLRSVRSTASDLGLQLGRKFSTKVEREKALIRVTRIY
ncbi:MAG: hypothetical protein J1D77_03505 [Muribaculaceae bacterium]|nr:hypothetical protein [Muribaculaceae bacterium]